MVSYTSSGEYPAINPTSVGTKKALEYAGIMLRNASGAEGSELSAIILYFYDHIKTKKEEEIAQAFHKISIVEMRHLEIFSETADILGYYPAAAAAPYDKRLRYWSGGNVKYNCSTQKILLQAIEAERMAMEKYLRQAQYIKDTNIQAILTKIASDEERHLEIFKELYSTIC